MTFEKYVSRDVYKLSKITMVPRFVNETCVLNRTFCNSFGRIIFTIVDRLELSYETKEIYLIIKIMTRKSNWKNVLIRSGWTMCSSIFVNPT